jgi:FkbH-like protein
MIHNKVKLVIWDLDDTFWRGTLTEEGITAIPRNREIVIELSRRGILNSICSKNDPDRVKAKLSEQEIWDYFVFPSISFSPKGKAVAGMIEAAGLRAENVLFIDDNKLNLEEVKFFNPGIMTAHPEEVLETLLDHPHCIGKPDPELTRLKQYRFLQRKTEERSTSELSNEEFLRASGIRVRIDYDIEKNFDRVVELINRTNQLNYTKERLNTPEEIENFRALLSAFRHVAGCVRAVDNYGDYGLIGFFLLKRTANKKRLLHFVFSCRTMNMGIEQYVYEMLGEPELDVVSPVSYPVQPHAVVDWINLEGESGGTISTGRGGKLVLLGGCDLLQLANYCSGDRVEFVNRVEEEVKVRYDDPGFVLSDRAAIRDCRAIREIPCWTYDDAVRFDESLAASDLVLVSLWPGMNGEYFDVEGVRLRMTGKQADHMRARDESWFKRNFQEVEISNRRRLRLITTALDRIGSITPDSSTVFLLGCFTQGDLNDKQVKRRGIYNEASRAYCDTHSPRFRYVDLDALLSREILVDKVHFSREGYFRLAQHILTSLRERRAPAPAAGATYIAAGRPQQVETGGSTRAGRKRERAARREGKRQGKLPEFADRLN